MRFEVAKEFRSLGGKPTDRCAICGNLLKEAGLVFRDSRLPTNKREVYRCHIDCAAARLGVAGAEERKEDR